MKASFYFFVAAREQRVNPISEDCIRKESEVIQGLFCVFKYGSYIERRDVSNFSILIKFDPNRTYQTYR